MMARGIGGVCGFRHTIGRNTSRLAGAQKFLFNDDSPRVPLMTALDQLDTPDTATYAFLIRRCGDEKSLSDGRRLHAHIRASGNDRNTFLANLLLQMYGKCGRVDDARNVFDKISQRNMFSWNFMIAIYAQNGHAVQALMLYRSMQIEGVKPNKFTFFPLLSATASLQTLAEGKHIHERIIACGYETDVAVRTALVNMYGKCGSLKDARVVFDDMHERNVILWTAIIAAYVQNGHGKDALELFRQMGLEGVKPDRVTFISALDACASLRSLEYGRRIHECIVACGFELDVAVKNALVNMYGKCGSLKDAQVVFNETLERNVISWAAMIAAYVQNGHAKEALDLFRQMILEGVKPNRVTFLSMLDACASLESLENGMWIHKHIVASGFEWDHAVRTALVNMYGKCGSLKDACRVFDKTHERNVILWTAMIATYVRTGRGKEALELFRQMDLEGVKPDRITFLSTLDACASLKSLENGKRIHECIVASGFESDIIVKNALVNMYGKCGSLKDAWVVFDNMHERNVISWTAMIAAYARNGHGKEALELFRQMELEGVKPNRITFLSTLDACASLVSLENGRVIHERIFASGFDSDVAMTNALVSMYGKCGSLKDADSVFVKMHERNVISWNCMIAAYAQNGHAEGALKLFQQMGLEGVKPDLITFLNTLDACASLGSLEHGRAIHEHIVASGFGLNVAVRNALVYMYGKCGSLKDACVVFGEMHERNLISWNAMIAAYAQNGHGKEALQLFHLMDLEGVEPDWITFLSTLDACANLASLENGRKLHERIVTSGFDSDVTVKNALVHMYGKCGSLKDARAVFDKMHGRNVTSWNAMIAAYSQNGCGKEAFELFRQMDLEGLKPDRITFLSILNTCSHAGLLHVGQQYFVSMSGDYGITPMEEHYLCMSGLLGRVGCLYEAEDLIVNMCVQPSAVSWNTLLGACRIHGDVERGARAAEHAFKLDPENASSYVLLSNIYVAAGRWNDAAKVRKTMEERVSRKRSGCS